MEALFHQPPFWAPGTVQPTLLPHGLSSSWKGVSVQPGNTLSWDMEEISLCVSPATCAQYFIPTTLPGSSE